LALPLVSFQSESGPEVRGRYIWSFWWRFRNTFDNRQKPVPYHYPKQGEGAPDTTAPAGEQARVVIPVANSSIPFIQTEPVTPLGRSSSSLRSDDLTVGTDNIALPLIPGGATGILQQGIFDPTIVTATVAGQPAYQLHEMQAEGDELLIGVTRATGTIADWTFSGGVGFSADSDFSLQLGNGSGAEIPDVGVYVTVGSAP